MKPFPFVFTENALSDIVNASIWYESKQVGLGIHFLNEVESSVKAISKTPLGFEKRYKHTIEKPLKKFPYTIIYTFDDGTIYVHAVFASRSNPAMKYKNF